MMKNYINTIKNNLEIEYYTNLYSYTKNKKINSTNIIDKINVLKEIYNQENNEKEITFTNTSEIDTETYSDNYLYQKSWNKLKGVHKIIKIKEFLSDLSINSNDRKNLENQLIKLIKDKTLTKKNSVYYNENSGKIISIPILSFKNNKYFINIV